MIGSNSFIPGFEDQLVGAKIGEDVEVNVTFPEEYQAKELAGCPAVFKCKVNEIKVKELPELDDDFAQDVSKFDTLAEYKEDVQAKLAANKADAAKRLNISTTKLRLLAKELNIDYKTKSFRKGKVLPNSHPEIDKQWLIENWVNTNKSMKQLAEEFNISEGLIDARRAKYKVSKKYKDSIDEFMGA